MINIGNYLKGRGLYKSSIHSLFHHHGFYLLCSQIPMPCPRIVHFNKTFASFSTWMDMYMYWSWNDNIVLKELPINQKVNTRMGE